MNDNPKNNILMPKNIRQKRLTILEYFVSSIVSVFCDIFQHEDFSHYRSYYMFCNCQEEMVFDGTWPGK